MDLSKYSADVSGEAGRRGQEWPYMGVSLVAVLGPGLPGASFSFI